MRIHSLGRSGFTAVLVWAVLTLAYLYIRVPLWNPAAPTLSTLLLAAELFGIGSLALHIFCTWTLVDRRAHSPPPGTRADIFVTTWNEPVEMLRNTLLAARAVRHAGTIWLLDDGARNEMKLLAEELGVAYLSRTDRSHAKAGNLNNALAHSTSDYIAIFDCDHAPSPEFLEKTLGYFNDPRIAFVQTPQDFYNTDSFQHRGNADRKVVWHEQTLFYRVIQPGKDRWNAAFFCGSCAIVRRRALEDVGGFSTGTITEDLHTSLKIHKRGWRSAFHSDALAFGLSPSNIDQYKTQRLRWGRGAMQVWLKEGFLFSKGLSLAQRLSYLASTSTYFEGWQKGIVYFLPIVVILTGWLPIAWPGPWLLILFTAWLLSGMMVNEVVSRGYAKTVWMEEYNFYRYFTFIRATLALILPINWRFVVTPKGRAVSERMAWQLLPQALVAAGAGLALAAGSYLYATRDHLPAGAFAVTVLFLSFNLMLSGKALLFAAAHLRQRRATHRFPIPLPVTVEGIDGFVLAEDVSSDGLMLVAPETGPVKILEGILHLPNGDLPFRGTVVRRIGSKLGIEFDWASAADADGLNACLYGNTLQWDINSWSETRRSAPVSGSAGSEVPEWSRWQLGILRSRGDREISCVARQEDENGSVWRAVSYVRQQSRDGIEISVGTRTGKNLVVASCETFRVGGGKVHVLTIAENPSLAPYTLHRRPDWTSDASAALPRRWVSNADR